MPDSKSTGLYPASEWKPGNHYKAFDWSAHDSEDLPPEVKRQMHGESAHGTKGAGTPKFAAALSKTSKQPAIKGGASPTPFMKLLSKRRTTK